MTDKPLTPDDEAQVLAAEFALGLLEDDEAEAARARMAEDAGFAAMVRMWQERLAGMAEELTPVMTPARAKLGIQRALGHSDGSLSDVPPIRAGRHGGGGSGGWMGWLLGAVAAGAVALAVILLPQGGADYAADLVADGGGLRVEARVDGRDLALDLTEGGAGEGRDLELWWIADANAVPISLGVLPRQGEARVTLPEDLTPGDTVQLALTDEPLGGSPTGQATGPIVAVAPLTRM